MRKRSEHLTSNAKDLRARQTKAESLVWTLVRGRRLCGLKFRPQFPIPPYIVDFACIEQKFIIEVDGGYHDMVSENDQAREQELESKGWRVVRFSNDDVLTNAEGVATAIQRHFGYFDGA